ncbi:MAG TPA: glycoside hydrolase family 88 protein [Polyangiaceae bacterium]|nr:glycoside hydrolase family 88 protein [Polyangiaceae bacterium]
MTRRVAISLLALLCGCGGSGARAGAAGASGVVETPTGAAGVGGNASVSSGGLSSSASAGAESNAGSASSGGSSSAGQAGAPSDGGTLGNAGAPSNGGRGGEVAGAAGASGLPTRASVLEVLRRANSYFVSKWPNPGQAIDSSHASHIWTRSVYYEGLLALYGVDPKPSDLEYAVAWATSHDWGLVGGATTRSADNQCAGQTYLALYEIDPQPTRIADIQSDIDLIVAGSKVDDWTWVDAIQMAMPVFAKLGVSSGKTAYFDKMYAMYSSARNAQGTAGFYSKTDHLWWRDADFDPPYQEPNGKACYWSRGNGWVFAALTRVLDLIPANEPHRAEYVADFSDMAEALRAVQRSDGFWNVSLHDPTHFGGPELTGTSLFTYGMAWGVRKGILPAASYQPTIERAWSAMASAVHDDGFLGYVQGTGKQPSDGQPLSFDKPPNFEDFGLGCVLLGGSEVARLAAP